MLLKTTRYFIYAAITIFLLMTYVFLRSVADQYEYCDRMLQTYAPICVKSAITDFQTEDVSAYTSDGTNNYGAGTSIEFNDYLNWLNSNGHSLAPLADQIRSEFSLYGVTPMNYALPYIDEEILQERATEYLREQLLIREQEDIRTRITDSNVEVTNVVKEVKPISNSGIWGNSSTFYSSASSYDKLYEYEYYISYYIEVKATATVNLQLPIFGGINIAPYNIEYTFNIPYELVN